MLDPETAQLIEKGLRELTSREILDGQFGEAPSREVAGDLPTRFRVVW